MIPLNVVSEQELMVLLQEGDHAAFTEIYNRYWDRLLHIAWNHSHNKDMAEDIVHELFLSIWTKRLPFQIMNVEGFLATKLRFMIFQSYRKDQRRSKLARANVVFDEIVNDDLKLDAQFLKEYINGVVEQLPDKCKMAFKYSREMGLKNAEISKAMNISEKGVEANLTRALKILRKNIESVWIISPFLSAVLLNILKKH